MKAIWNDKIIAKSNDTIVVEGNHYFPPKSINEDFFKETTTHTECPWKGTASYYTLEADGKQSEDAAWYYPEPKKKAKNIENYVAFWKDVEVKE